MELLRDIDKETVEFEPNFDGYEVQPVVLPARFPNLLVNGSSGIAVGMATNIPPHNLGEVIDAVVAAIDDPEITIRDLMKKVKGPDFPTAGLIIGRDGIRDAYEHGRGSVKMRARVSIEESRQGRERLVPVASSARSAATLVSRSSTSVTGRPVSRRSRPARALASTASGPSPPSILRGSPTTSSVASCRDACSASRSGRLASGSAGIVVSGCAMIAPASLSASPTRCVPGSTARTRPISPTDRFRSGSDSGPSRERQTAA